MGRRPREAVLKGGWGWGGVRAIIDECRRREKAVGCLVPAINTNQKALHLIRTAVVADGLQSPTSLFGADIEQPPTSRSRKGDKEIEVRGWSLGYTAGRRKPCIAVPA